MIKLIKQKSGYTLVETLIYLAIFIVISLVIISLILSVLETSRQVTPINSLSRGAVSVLEIMTREIRAAQGIDIANSFFGTSTGSLRLNTLSEAGAPRVVKFYLNSDTVKLDEDGMYIGPLTTKNLQVDSLFFSLATTTSYTLVKIELDLSTAGEKYQKSERFYSSVKVRLNN